MKRKLLLLLLAILVAGCATPAGNPAATSLPTALSPDANQPSTQPGSVAQASGTDEMMAGCTTVSPHPTPGPTQESLFTPVSEADWVYGPYTATMTIIEYSDFQCPFCAQLAPVLKQLVQDFKGRLRLVYRHFPLIGTPEQPFHDKAALAVQAAEAAALQGKFWEMHELLMGRQREWSGMSGEDFTTWAIQRASELGLDVEKFTTDLHSEVLAKLAQDAWDKGQQMGLPGTPFVVVNGNIWPNNLPISYENIASVLKLEDMEKIQYTACPPMVIDPLKQYVATIHTVKGDMVVQLYASKAPLAVNNFVFLARDGWYNGVTFHRVIPDFMAQSGDPSNTGFGSPGYTFVNEISDLKFDKAGILAMANAGPDTNGSQFFITYAPAPHLDGSYTIFGQILTGMEVLEALTPRDPSQAANLPPGDAITSIDIDEK